MLTTNILTKNNEETIEETIKSVLPVSNSIIVGDLGSTDRTLEICNDYKVKIYKISHFKNDLSKAKNEIIKKNKSWIFFIEPYEVLFEDTRLDFQSLNSNYSYKVNFVKSDLITKEIRVWHSDKNLKFNNPVFESVEDKESKNLDIFLIKTKEYIDEEKIKILKEWMDKNPISNKPLYYWSCVKLTEKKWREFLNYGFSYIHKEKSSNSSSIMIKYYIAMIKTYIKNEIDYKKAIELLLSCIYEKPVMAEFWCLLGDVYLSLGENEKARSFYENAILLGASRENDDMPIENSKYKDYPIKMINSCAKAKEETKLLKGIVNR